MTRCAYIPPIGIGDAMASDQLFGPAFAGRSWETWRAIIKAAHGESLTPAELLTFRQVASRDPPSKRVRELVAVVGRGGGKDSIASLIAAHTAIGFDPRGTLRPGEKACVMCLAVDRHQARIVFGYIKAFFELIPTLREMVVDIANEAIELRNGVVIEVHTNSYRSIRGRSVICAILDECSFWRDENSAIPDIEVHGALTPGLARMPGSMLILISSAHKRSGLLYQRWRDYFGKNDDNVLVVHGSTLQFNSTFDDQIIAQAIDSDPERYRAEYLSEWRDDLSSLFGRELLDAAVDTGVLVRPPQPNISYVAGCDPSGGRADSFTFAIAHRERVEPRNVVVDLLFERRSPFNPSEVVEEIVALMRQYHVSKVTGDKYAAQWSVEAFAKAGVRYEQSERDRSAVYMDAMPIFASGRARLLDHQKTVNQFAALERRTFSTGRDRIDPGPGHDDCANSVAIALTLADAKRGPLVISDATVARSRMPLAGFNYGKPVPTYFPNSAQPPYIPPKPHNNAPKTS